MFCILNFVLIIQGGDMPPASRPEQLNKIAFLEGNWNVIMSVKPDPTRDWIDTRGESTFAWILNGTILEQTYDGDMMGRPFLGKGHLAFNRFTGKWQHTWSDNTAAILSIYEGDFENDRLAVIGRENTGRARFSVRVTWSDMSPDKFDWMLETSMDDKEWNPVMKAAYSRKTD